MRIHFIGCEGASMKVLMKLAAREGAAVTGSDAVLSGHDEKFAAGADMAVYSSAIPEDNPEMVYAKTHGIELVSRAEYLGRVAAKYGSVIAVAGSHGKTTCTAMLGSIFAPYNATVHFGGEYNGECGHVGDKRFFITEACEYRRNFLHLLPKISVVLNVELDHTDYYRDLADITRAFDVFSRSAPTRLVNGDDEASAPLRTGKYITFGFGQGNEYRARDVSVRRGGATFTLWHNGESLGEIRLQVPGRHNVLDALAAAATALSAGVSIDDVRRGLASFTGVKRRLENLGSPYGCDLYTDYAHHPREIRSTIECLREAGYTRIGVVFEPHTYSRTASLLPEFAAALMLADDILLAEIYAAREKPIAGVSSQLLCRAILEKGRAARVFATFFELNEAAEELCKKDAALVYCGAGTIDTAARALACGGR